MYKVVRLPPLRPSFDWGPFLSSTPWLGECCFTDEYNKNIFNITNMQEGRRAEQKETKGESQGPDRGSILVD